MLLDPSSPNCITFDIFSRDMESLLSPAIWSGKRYEDGRHKAGEISWHRVRAGIQETCHRGAIYAGFEIPVPWWNPKSFVADKDGLDQLGASFQEHQVVRSAPVPLSTWFKVEVTGYRDAQSDEAVAIAATYQALGYRFVLSPVQLKDAQGHTIPHSTYQLELLYKSRRRQLEVCRDVKALLTDPTISVSTVTLEQFSIDRLNMFHFAVDPHYINHLYAVSVPSHERDALLKAAPPYDIPPAIHSTSAEERANANTWYLWRLAHFGLLEYGDVYPLPGYSPGDVDATYLSSLLEPPPLPAKKLLASHDTPAPTPPRTALPVAELSLDKMCELAFASPSQLSPDDRFKLQRLYLSLRCVQRRAPFNCSIFPIPSSPYRALLAGISKLTVESSQQGLADFHHQMEPPNTSLGVWDERISMNIDGRVKIVMDSSVDPQWDETAVAGHVKRYVDICLRMTARSNPHKRRRKRAQKDVAKASTAGGPSSSV